LTTTTKAAKKAKVLGKRGKKQSSDSDEETEYRKEDPKLKKGRGRPRRA
jgi:hypothetical protein